MIDPDLAARLDVLEKKVDAAYAAAEKVRKYIWWTGVVTLALIVIPAIGLIFVIPQFINTYTTELNGIGN